MYSIRRIATTAAALASLPLVGISPASVASADTLSNGMEVRCDFDDVINEVVCHITGCPRVHGEYLIDAVHVRQDGGPQHEENFLCSKGEGYYTYMGKAPDPGKTTQVSVQGCRKKDLEGDWCTAWADYTYRRPIDPRPPAPADLHVEKYITAACSPPSGQDCKVEPLVYFDASAGQRVQIGFTPDVNACSDAEFQFRLDNDKVGAPAIGRAGKTLVVGPVTIKETGQHRAGLTAKGIKGGCNTGTLESWGGTITVARVP